MRRGSVAEQQVPIGVAREGVAREKKRSRSWVIGITSFFFILLQSACAAVMAISGLRLLIGVGSLAAASGLKVFVVAFHADAIRIPMMLVAVGGSVLNLYVIWRMRSLRARPSSQWRVSPVTPKQKRAESFQIVLAVSTLALVVLEELLHFRLHGA